MWLAPVGKCSLKCVVEGSLRGKRNVVCMRNWRRREREGKREVYRLDERAKISNRLLNLLPHVWYWDRCGLKCLECTVWISLSELNWFSAILISSSRSDGEANPVYAYEEVFKISFLSLPILRSLNRDPGWVLALSTLNEWICSVWIDVPSLSSRGILEWKFLWVCESLLLTAVRSPKRQAGILYIFRAWRDRVRPTEERFGKDSWCEVLFSPRHM